MGQALDVVNRYYGVWDKNGEGMEDLIAENFSFVGPLATADRKGFLEAAPQLGQMFQKFDFHKKFEDGDQVCCLYDLEMATPAGNLTVPMAEWLKVAGGKIREIKLYYDPRELAAAM